MKIGGIAALAAAFLVVAGGQRMPAQVKAARYAQTAPSERLTNLDKLKDELKAYHACTCSCGCYARDLDLQAAKAIAFLEKRAGKEATGKGLALVLDIDETTLSNYAQMERSGFAYDAKAFAAWEQEAKAPAIEGTLRLYKVARELGVKVFFLTGRPERERGATERDLRAQGFSDWEGLILRKPDEAKLTALAYKSAERQKIARDGYTIVLNVGDQWSDLKGRPEAEYSVKYPNPYYYIP